jgi:hypothetical protein
LRYVMVPVPEEHVEDVMQYVLRERERASLEPWDSESIGRLFKDVDEPTRSLLSVVARATSAGKELTERDAGDLVELSARDVSAIEHHLKEQAREAGREPLITVAIVGEARPSGRTQRKRVLTMDEEVATFVRDAERVELMSGPHPLEGQPQ